MTLRCPAVGTVRVDVTVCGEPVADGTLVELTVRDRGWRSGIVAETVDGAVTFWPVGVGTQLDALVELADASQPVVCHGQGPSQAGETVTFVAASTQHLAVVTGRVVARDGLPLRNTRFGASPPEPQALPGPNGTEYRGGVLVQTDEEGRFEVAVLVACDSRQPQRWTLDSYQPSRCHGELIVPPSGCEIDVGDVVVTTEAPFATGIVVDERGEPLAGIRVGLVRPTTDSSSGWSPIGAGGTSDAQGRFTVPPVEEAGDDVWLHADRSGTLRQDPVRIHRGTRDVRIVMQRAGVLEARLQLDDGVPLDQLDVQVWPESRGAPSSNPSGWTIARKDDDGRIHADGLPPDSYTVMVTLPPWREIARVAGVAVYAGRINTDVRLAPFDLRGRIGTLDLTVHDEAGTRRSADVFERAGRQVEYLGRSDHTLLFPAADAVDTFVVVGEGDFHADVGPQTGKRDVELDRGLPVVVHVDGAPPLQAPYSVVVALQALAPRAGSNARRAAAVGPPGPDHATIGDDPDVALRVPETGDYRVRVTLRCYDQGYVDVEDVTPEPAPQVHVTAGGFDAPRVVLDEARVQRALVTLKSVVEKRHR